MNKLLAILVCLFLSSCNTGSDKVDLRWKIKPGDTIKYSAMLSEIKLEPDFKLDGFEVLKSLALKNKVNEALKIYKGPVDTLEITLTSEKEGFKAKFLSIKPEYDSLPKDDLEKIQRDRTERRAGTVDILAWLL